MEEYSDERQEVNPLALGAAYLDYCVRQGWLTKTGQGERAQYSLTPDGERKLADVPFNFDLSKLAKKGGGTRRRRRRRR